MTPGQGYRRLKFAGFQLLTRDVYSFNGWVAGGGGIRKFALGPFGEENRPQIGKKKNANLGVFTLFYASIKGF